MRIALAVSARGTSQLVRLWIDGEPAGPTWPQGRLDSHMSLDEEVHFFADGDGFTGSGLVSSIALYDAVLTEGEVAALGGATAGGVAPQLPAVPRRISEPEALQLADAVIIPPEPGRELPTYSVWVSGDHVIASQGIGRGASGGAWLYEQTLESHEWQLTSLAPPDENLDRWRFGFNAGVHGDWAAVAAVVEPVDGHSEAGALHLYHKSGGKWTWVQKLVSADPAASNVFGQWFSMSDDLMVVAEARKTGIKRRANIYERITDCDSGEMWKFAGIVDRTRNNFGRAAVFPDAGTIVIKTGRGSISLLKRKEGNWVEVFEFNPGGDFNSFGSALSCDADTLLAGWPKPQSNQPGEALIFRRDHGGTNAWQSSGRITAPLSCQNPSDFGVQVAIEGNRAVIAERSPDRKTAIIHQFERSGLTGESWREIATPLVIPDINGFSISTRFAAASLPFEGGRVLVFDLER
ncbi:MAG: hypothetical protein ACI9R3_002279 [Verrucomicrobiales bacterium]